MRVYAANSVCQKVKPRRATRSTVEHIPTTFRIGGRIYERVRYGEEEEDWGADRQPCHDCGVTKGELHIFGCDVERCPRCESQALYCECPYDDRHIDEPRTKV
jgi:hypothetical protein